MNKPQNTKAFLQQLGDFLGKIENSDATEIEWEKGDYGFKATLAPGRKQPTMLPTNGKNESHVERFKIISPVVGTFHFLMEEVFPGRPIKPKVPVGFVESVNVDHPVEAEQPGQIIEIHVEEGQPVEYGQPLFTLEVFRVP